MGIVSFNGVTTEDLDLIVQTPPVHAFSEKDSESYHVPGKNGDVIIDSGSYKNVERTYNIAAILKPNGGNFTQVARKITSWLMSAKGYARLEDTYEPRFFRYAMYRKGNEMLNYYDQATTLNVTFECKPQRYLKDGDVFIELYNDIENAMINPFNFVANPILQVSCLQDATISFCKKDNNDDFVELYKITITEAVNNLIIDTELQDCYTESGYKNDIVVLKDKQFPKLEVGTIYVIIDSNVTSAKIKPRWWTL